MSHTKKTVFTFLHSSAFCEGVYFYRFAPLKYLKLLLTICFVFSACISFSQQINADSLIKLFQTDKPDTSKVIHAYKLCWEYIKKGHYDTAMYYGNTALELAQQLNFKRGIAGA